MSKTRQPSKRPVQRAERSGDYEVGYGKPPVSTRFKPGQSGNPKGRPRGSKGFNALMRRALSETILVREDGQLRQMSRREVIIKSWIARALKGDARAIERLLPFMQQLYPDIANQMEIRVVMVRAKDKPDADNGGGSAT
jgi:hypothetical protein